MPGFIHSFIHSFSIPIFVICNTNHHLFDLLCFSFPVCGLTQEFRKPTARQATEGNRRCQQQQLVVVGSLEMNQ